MTTLRFGTLVLAGALALANAACGDSGGSGGSSTTGGNGGGGGGTASVNGCTAASAKSEAGDVTIKFGGVDPGIVYDPGCISIKKGAKVTWEGDFTSHPLQAGVVPDDGSANTVDGNSPIKETTTGTTKTFTFSNAGTFGFYCEIHFASGMKGAVIVE